MIWASVHRRLAPSDRRRELIAAGMDIARESGFPGLTVDAVAARAQCHANSVRRYLGRRELLCLAIAARAWEVRDVPVIRDARRYGYLK